MIKIIIMFFPSILSVAISEKFEKKNYDLKKWLYNYVFYILINQFVLALLLSLIFDGENIFLVYQQYTNLVAVKYLAISLVLSVLIPVIINIVKNNLSINVSLSKKRNKK